MPTNKAGRQVSPTSTNDDIIYSDEEREFLVAMERFKREKRRPFPNCSDVLLVLKSLGYCKEIKE